MEDVDLAGYAKEEKIISDDEVRHIVHNLSTVSTSGIRWQTREVKQRRCLFDIRCKATCREFNVQFTKGTDHYTIIARKYIRGNQTSQNLIVYRNRERLRFRYHPDHREAQRKIDYILRTRFFTDVDRNISSIPLRAM